MKAEQQQQISIVGLLFGVCVEFWADTFADFAGPILSPDTAGVVPPVLTESAPTTEELQTRILTLISGLLFLLDILCILWWYVKYIYRIKPLSTLSSHFLDFAVVAAFILAANIWTKPEVFLVATSAGAAFLFVRFFLIYRDPDATDTDRRILKRALFGLSLAAVIVVLMGLAALGVQPDVVPKDTTKYLILPASPGLLSAIGIFLTIWLRDDITVAAEIHEIAARRFVPMRIHWPQDVETSDRDLIRQIRNFTTEGLKALDEMFEDSPGKLSLEKLKSRVHAEGDLRVQSYIVSVSSIKGKPEQEIKRKAFMVAVSHWLDDLVDGRNEVAILRSLRRFGSVKKLGLFGKRKKVRDDYGLKAEKGDIEHSKELFEHVYKKLIIRYTNKEFYRLLLQKIENDSAALGQNTKYLFWALYRVALGSVIFGPKVRKTDREHLLQKHNEKLIKLVDASPAKDSWKEEVKSILNDMQTTSVGKILLGLTTKTVQEMAMAGEAEGDVNFALSLLYSLLYAPLLYFHDVEGELEQGEIVPLDAFDVNYDLIISWISDLKDLCEDDRVKDDRRNYRLLQLEMAYFCFEDRLPESVAAALAPFYVPVGRAPRWGILRPVPAST